MARKSTIEKLKARNQCLRKGQTKKGKMNRIELI